MRANRADGFYLQAWRRVYVAGHAAGEPARNRTAAGSVRREPSAKLPVTTLLDDLRFARRMFVRRRRFASLLVATIVVGIGAATSIFSIVDVVLWKPLPYPDADRLYWIARTDETWRASPVLAAVWDNM